VQDDICLDRGVRTIRESEGEGDSIDCETGVFVRSVDEVVGFVKEEEDPG